MEKDLNDKLKQEKLSYFRSKEYRGEQLKVIMDAIDYGIGTDYLQLFDDTAIPAGIMKNMLTAMKEDYGVQEAAFLSAVRQEESGRILLEALKSGVPLPELQAAYRDGMFPIELREKILPLMQGREAIPEKIGEKMEFITEAVRELKESYSMQNSFIEDLKKAMENKPDIFSVQEKGTGADTEVDPYYLELEEQFRQAREDAERLLEEAEEMAQKLSELAAVQATYEAEYAGGGSMAETIGQYAGFQELSAEIVHALVKRIVFFGEGRVEIEYTSADEMMEFVELAECRKGEVLCTKEETV